MNANIFGAVARRLAQNFNHDSGINIRNRVLTASCLFHLARLSGELTSETIDLWLKAMVGKLGGGFSQIHLLEICRAFQTNQPEAFQSLWEGESAPLYEAIGKLDGNGDPYQNILKWTLLAVAGEFYETGGRRITDLLKKLKAEQFLTPEEWLEIVYLKFDIRRFLNAEIGEIAFSHLTSPTTDSKIVEVEVIL